jgi:hypothetical protein
MPPHAALHPDHPPLPKVPRNLDSANSPHPKPAPARTSAPPPVKARSGAHAAVERSDTETGEDRNQADAAAQLAGAGAGEDRNGVGAGPQPAGTVASEGQNRTGAAQNRTGAAPRSPMQAPNQQKPWPINRQNQRQPWPVKRRTHKEPGPVKAGNQPAQATNQQKPRRPKTRTHKEPGPVKPGNQPAQATNQQKPRRPKTRNHKEPGPVRAGKGSVGMRNRTRGGPGGRPPDGVAVLGAGCQRQPSMTSQLVGEEGFEPSRPRGHTDLNRARLPFRHPPRATSQVSTTSCLPSPPIRSDASRGRRYPGGSATALRAKARRHG